MDHKGRSKMLAITPDTTRAMKKASHPQSRISIPRGVPATAAPMYAKRPAKPVAVAAAFLWDNSAAATPISI